MSPLAHEDRGRTHARSLLGDALRQAAERERTRELEETVPFLEWSRRVPEPKSGPLDFRRFPFQVELYGQGAADREAVIKKATQMGVSAFLLRWALYWADTKGLTALYVFPRRKQMYDFADARVDAAIAKSPYLAGRMGYRPGTDAALMGPARAGDLSGKRVDNKGLKRVGGGWVYFRGSESEDDLDAVDADILCLDEYDRLRPDNVPVAERRISGSQLALLRRVGVPTVPNFGLARLYAASDRRRWLVRCPGCRDEQPLTWADNVLGPAEERGHSANGPRGTTAPLRRCRSCRVELRPQDIAAGRWAAENPDAEVRGYDLPKLVMPQVDMAALWERSRRTLPEERQAFWNRDMAEPYAPEEGRLSPQAIASATRAELRLETGYAGMNPVTMGVDVADTRALHVRISEHLDVESGLKRALWIGRAASFDEVALLMDRYRVQMCAVDHEPSGRLAQGLAERFAGRVYLVHYSNGEQVLTVNEDLRSVGVRRVEAIDATFEAVRAQRNLLPAELPAGYAEEMTSMVRITEKDATGRKRTRYLSTGPDDYAHAEAYDVVAGELWRRRRLVDAGAAERLSVLEDHLEFERSALTEERDVYREGPGEAYVPGAGESGYATALDGADASDWTEGYG